MFVKITHFSRKILYVNIVFLTNESLLYVQYYSEITDISAATFSNVILLVRSFFNIKSSHLQSRVFVIRDYLYRT